MPKAASILTLLPSIGVLLFCVLYAYAASLYPGGSQANPDAIGFDWKHNYWCNLTNAEGINGMANPAKPVALVAMVLLCSSMTLFFFQFSRHFELSGFWKWAIPVMGTGSMLSAVFIATKHHDAMTTASSLLGLVVVFGIIRTIYRSRLRLIKASGALCMLLLGLNNAIYYSGYGIAELPIVQKATFVVVLAWIVGLNLIVFRKGKHPAS